MHLERAHELALRLMAEHGLVGWTFGFDRARTRAGACFSARRHISLSAELTQLHPDDQVRDTVLHEIAHALVGPHHGHDAVWRGAARRMGCSGQRCVSADLPRPTPPWQGVCPAGHHVGRHKRPVRVMSCSTCRPGFDLSAVFSWTYRGRVVPMDSRYVAEQRRIGDLGPHRPPPPAAMIDT